MLTVKHIDVTGHENIYPAVRVSFQPRQRNGYEVGPEVSGDDVSAPCVFVDTEKGDVMPLGSWGAFYVMNDSGKTVAKYDLGGWLPPSSPPPTRT